MKLYVDDVRIAPDGWAQAWNAKQAIKYLAHGNVTHLSLDHDLGDPNEDTGYLPEITFHTANPTGRKNMQAALDAIIRRQNKC
jgi:hypothetical protein